MTQNRQPEPATEIVVARESWQQPDVRRVRAGEAESTPSNVTEFTTGNS